MRKVVALAIIMILSTFSQAQDFKNDIGVNFNQTFAYTNEKRFGLELRHGLGENFKLKFGTEFGKSDRDIWNGNSVLYGSDSLTITRDFKSLTTNQGINAGIDYEGINYLSLGVAVYLGTSRTTLAGYDKGARYDPDNSKWENCLECVYEYYEEDLPPVDNASLFGRQYSSILKVSNYFRYGIRLRAGIRIPIKNRFELSSAYEPTFVRNHLINETIYNTFDAPSTHTTDSFNQISHAITVAVRYKF